MKKYLIALWTCLLLLGCNGSGGSGGGSGKGTPSDPSRQKPAGTAIAGWPNYIAMGAIGGPNIDPTQIKVGSGGDDSFGGAPVDAVFKYAGINGNGDPGVIDPPMNIINMTKDLTNVSKYNNYPSRVVMVEYTAQMSGGQNFDDFTNTDTPSVSTPGATYIMARHFISLASDALALAQNPVVYAGKNYYGALILDPDLLGAMQQNNYIGSVNNLLNDGTVNSAVDQTLCFLQTTRSYTNTYAPNGNNGQPYINKTYTGTPFAILTAMLNDGYPGWSINSSNDPYWNTSTNNESSQVGTWMNECINTPSNGAHPSFPSGFDGWIQANNWLVRYFGNIESTDVSFGWQDNMWAVNSGNWVNSNSDLTTSEIASTYSTPVISWLSANAPSAISKVGTEPAPDFFVFDRYENDDSAGGGQGTLYNSQSWDNYLNGIGLISKAFDNIPLVMWQIPGSHLPYIGEANPQLFPTGGYIFSTAPDYFFGDSNLGSSLNNLVMGPQNNPSTNLEVGNYIMPSIYNCSGCIYKNYLLSGAYDWSKDDGKLFLAASNNVAAILWGGGNTTNVIHNFSNPDDHGWLAGRIRDYYINPQKLNPAQ
jgi:hypothetical protein